MCARLPFTSIRPAVIHSSIVRRDAIPARARVFCSFSDSGASPAAADRGPIAMRGTKRRVDPAAGRTATGAASGLLRLGLDGRSFVRPGRRSFCGVGGRGDRLGERGLGAFEALADFFKGRKLLQ